MGTAEAGFDYVLDQLPFNKHRLSTDASTSFGMAGVMRFGKRLVSQTGVHGFF